MRNVTDRQRKNGREGKLWTEYLAMVKIWAGTTWSNFYRRSLRKRRTKR